MSEKTCYNASIKSISTSTPRSPFFPAKKIRGGFLVLGEHQFATQRIIGSLKCLLDERYNRNNRRKAGKMGWIIGQQMGYAIGEHGCHDVGIVDLPPANLGLLNQVIK